MSDSAKYSAPMPAIGLYIAGATLVCFLLMLCDILNGIRQRKPWIPCRFFVLNSFTLTLLSVASKLPVDLTTSMPSAFDQLSKLCGTCMICISIGFFTPSLGNMSESEYSANLASLTIMVITVVVNISIQMTTGVIFLFKLEHAITLVSMLLLLGLANARGAKASDLLTVPFQEVVINKPRGKIQPLLENCYIFGYLTNPQFFICASVPTVTVGMLCTICFVTLSEAAIRAFHLEGLEYLFRKDLSDYKWSIWAVLAIQFLTLIVGTLTIALRPIAVPSGTRVLNFNILRSVSLKLRVFLGAFKFFLNFCKFFLILDRNWELYIHGLMNFPREIFHIFQVLESIIGSVLCLIKLWALCMGFLGIFIARAMRKIVFCFGFLKCDDGFDPKMRATQNSEFSEITSAMHNPALEFFISADHLLWKVKKDKEMFVDKHSADPMHSLVPFLRSNHEPVLLLQPINKRSDKLLLLVCLVRIVDALMPSTRSEPLVSAFDKIFEIIAFIHGKTKPMLLSSNLKMNIAKDIWMSRANRCHWFQNDFIEDLKFKVGGTGPDSSLSDYVNEVTKTSQAVALAFTELRDISKIINGPKPDSINGNNDPAPMEDVYNRMEKLFVKLLHWYIDQFPDAVFKSLTEPCIGNQFEENAKLCLKFVCKLLRLEVKWGSLGTNIKTFMTSDHPFDAPENQQAGSEESGTNDDSDRTNEDIDGNFVIGIPAAQEDHEITEVAP